MRPLLRAASTAFLVCNSGFLSVNNIVPLHTHNRCHAQQVSLLRNAESSRPLHPDRSQHRPRDPKSSVSGEISVQVYVPHGPWLSAGATGRRLGHAAEQVYSEDAEEQSGDSAASPVSLCLRHQSQECVAKKSVDLCVFADSSETKPTRLRTPVQVLAARAPNQVCVQSDRPEASARDRTEAVLSCEVVPRE